MKAVREGSIIGLRSERPTRERVPKVIERPGVFRDRNHSVTGQILVLVLLLENSLAKGILTQDRDSQLYFTE